MERFLSPDARREGMPDSSECPECGGRVSTTNGTEYVCDECGREFDSADLFLP